MKWTFLHFFLFHCLVATTLVAQTTDLELRLSANVDTYTPATELEFTLELYNTGNATTDATVNFTLPSGTSLLGVSSTNGNYLVHDATWRLTQLTGGSRARLRVRVYNFNVVTTIRAFAQVASATLADPDSTPGNATNNIVAEDDEAILNIPSVMIVATDTTVVKLLQFPDNEQLFPRTVATNQGLATIAGWATGGQTYTSLRAKLFRAEVLQETYSSNLNYTNDTAYFELQVPILAELVDYKIELYAINTIGEETLLRTANNLVAGDAYIINGQSNAQANVAPHPSDNRHFARTFTLEQGWVNAQFAQQGSGQWGARMAASIIDEQQIPVAIFNEAVGGKRIDFYLKNEETIATGNYGNLYRRLEAAQLREDICAGFWFQGEADGWVADTTFLEIYKQKFKSIHQAWLEDYRIKKCYIFQVRYQSCLHLYPYVMEAQRQLQYELLNVATMSTTNTAHDSCHYYYENGYE
ncbi:MAG: sialate O-acetylesterase, partial [Bacteroidota bacterium]